MSALGAWIASREPAAPPALRARLTALFAAHPEWDHLDHCDALRSAGEMLLRRVLDSEPRSRQTALDLLAADACITYAFEAAADAPERVAERARAAALRIAACV